MAGFPFQAPHSIRHTLLGGNAQTQMHMVGHGMPFDQLDAHLMAEFPQNLADVLAERAKDCFLRVFSIITGSFVLPLLYEWRVFVRLSSILFVGIAQHVQGDAVGEVLLGTHAIDRLLHLAVATVPPFHGVGGRGEQFVIEKRQRLVQVGERACSRCSRRVCTGAPAGVTGRASPRRCRCDSGDRTSGRLPP